jgi:hypothetical protein
MYWFDDPERRKPRALAGSDQALLEPEGLKAAMATTSPRNPEG